MCGFPYKNLRLGAAQDVARLSGLPSDRHLSLIVRAQRLMEEIGDTVADADGKGSLEAVIAEIGALRQRAETLHSDVEFSKGRSESFVLRMQMCVIDSQIRQCLLPGFPFAMRDSRLHQRPSVSSSSHLAELLSDSISAAKMQADILGALPAGHEFFLTNLEWMSAHQGLCMGAKLDVVARDPRVAHLTEPSRRFLDVRHAIRQTIVRLELASTPGPDASGDRDAMWHFCRRAGQVERWLLSRTSMPDSLMTPATATTATSPMMATPASDTPSIAADDMIDPLLFTVGSPTDGFRAATTGPGSLGQHGTAGPGPAEQIDFSIMDLLGNDSMATGYGYDVGRYVATQGYQSAR